MRIPRSIRNIPLITAVCSLAVGVTLSTAGPASARTLVLDHFHDEGNAVIEDFCGDLNVSTTTEVDGFFMVSSHGSDTLYEMTNVRFTAVLTNLDNGRSITQRAALHNKDVKIEDNGDGTYTVHARATGVIQTRGPDGRLFALNAAALWYDLLISDSGTPDDPFDDELIEETVVRSVGRDDTAGRDFCADAHELIG